MHVIFSLLSSHDSIALLFSPPVAHVFLIPRRWASPHCRAYPGLPTPSRAMPCRGAKSASPMSLVLTTTHHPSASDRGRTGANRSHRDRRSLCFPTLPPACSSREHEIWDFPYGRYAPHVTVVLQKQVELVCSRLRSSTKHPLTNFRKKQVLEARHVTILISN